MKYKGVIIEESLGDRSLLGKMHIIDTKVEKVTPKHKTSWLKEWTLHTVEIPEENADQIAIQISHAFDKKHPNWYMDFKNDRYHYIIYFNKLFKVNLQNPRLYKNAKKYGVSIGIPEYQVDFAPKDEVWKR